MAKIKQSVFDAGPFIHLHEIEKLDLVALFEAIFVTAEVLQERKGINLNNKNIKKKNLLPASKDFTKYLIDTYNLDLGEATAIALCKQEQVKLFFTDDLDARETANNLGFEAQGTIAIILRAFREKQMSKNQTKETIEKLYEQSTIFLTNHLKKFVLAEIEKY